MPVSQGQRGTPHCSQFENTLSVQITVDPPVYLSVVMVSRNIMLDPIQCSGSNTVQQKSAFSSDLHYNV